jgi:hypothetical protein
VRDCYANRGNLRSHGLLSPVTATTVLRTVAHTPPCAPTGSKISGFWDSKRDRSLITVAALIANYHPVQMGHHIHRALKNRVTKDEIIEMITHLAFYTGWAGSMSAAEIAMEAFEDE